MADIANFDGSVSMIVGVPVARMSTRRSDSPRPHSIVGCSNSSAVTCRVRGYRMEKTRDQTVCRYEAVVCKWPAYHPYYSP